LKPDAENGQKYQPKIRDVAKIAGVSTATVSRVLSDPSKVSDDTRNRVVEAVEATGYRVNQQARNLRRNKTGGIVVLVPRLENPFFSSILSAIARTASKRGFNVLIVDTREIQAADSTIADYLDDNRCDGLIVLDGNLPQSLFTGARRPPVVFACEWIEDHGYPAIMIDNRLGAEMAINHLIGLGHRRIGHLKGIEDNLLTRLRFAGVQDALRQAGLSLADDHIFTGDFSLGAGVAAAKSWCALTDRPSAIFCASDVMAFGFISELHRQGFRVPQDISVVGFDDIEISEHFIPPLTTIHQPREAIGESAAELLFSVMQFDDGLSRPLINSEVLSIDLVVRGSTAKPSAA
jgi:LacI family repressor for deo operon, udp, cdd, tsx, nupC, and nupG